MIVAMDSQSRQSARLSLQSSLLGLHHPSPADECVTPPPPCSRVGTHSLAGEGAGGSQFERGDRHCVTLGIYVLYFVYGLF
jgi:hypothetical protein